MEINKKTVAVTLGTAMLVGTLGCFGVGSVLDNAQACPEYKYPLTYLKDEKIIHPEAEIAKQQTVAAENKKELVNRIHGINQRIEDINMDISNVIEKMHNLFLDEPESYKELEHGAEQWVQDDLLEIDNLNKQAWEIIRIVSKKAKEETAAAEKIKEKFTSSKFVSVDKAKAEALKTQFAALNAHIEDLSNQRAEMEEKMKELKSNYASAFSLANDACRNTDKVKYKYRYDSELKAKLTEEKKNLEAELDECEIDAEKKVIKGKISVTEKMLFNISLHDTEIDYCAAGYDSLTNKTQKALNDISMLENVDAMLLEDLNSALDNFNKLYKSHKDIFDEAMFKAYSQNLK